MLSIALFQLRAENLAENIHRFYDIEVCKDLLGDWVLVTCHGPMGQRGKRKQYGYSCFEEMAKKLQGILRNRFNAGGTGYNYTLVSFYARQNLDQFESVIKGAHLQKGLLPVEAFFVKGSRYAAKKKKTISIEKHTPIPHYRPSAEGTFPLLSVCAGKKSQNIKN